MQFEIYLLMDYLPPIMFKGSKNRLMPIHEHLFPGDTLFDRIARAVCSAGVLPRKELYEAWECARRVRRRYRGGRVLDLACGHGLLAHIMLILDDSSDVALAVDREIPMSAAKLSQSLINTWPRLEGRITYRKNSIEEIEISENDVVVSVHACGSLTDLVLRRAMEKRVRVAVMPCCHDLTDSFTCGLEGWMDGPLAIDSVRAAWLAFCGYQVVTQTIDSDITPKNRLLMGEYKGSSLF